MYRMSFREGRRLWGDESGNIGMIFAMMIIPIVMVIGMSFDVGRGYSARTQMQATLDAAVLAAAKRFDATGSTTQAEQAARAYFEAQIDPGLNAEITQITADAQGNIHMAAEGFVETGFLKIASVQSVPFSARASSLTTDQGGMDLELAIVFDVTGSMLENNRLVTAKAAATDLINILMPPGVNTHRSVRISLVPFSQTVNVGLDLAETFTGQPRQKDVTTTTYVWVERQVCVRYRSNGTCRQWETQWVQEPQTTTTRHYLRPCMIERPQATGNAYTDAPPVDNASYFRAIYSTNQNAGCTPNSRVVPLTDNRNTLLTAINALQATGGTAGHIGTAWGWYTISHNWESMWPMDRRPAMPDPENRLKAVIIMTDGEYNYHYDNNGSGFSENSSNRNLGNGPSEAQALQICQNMKDNGIEVFAVGVEITQSAKAALMQCVSSPNHLFEQHYYDVVNNLASQGGLRAAFQAIGESIARATGTGNQNARITR
jgi:Flp pilus assembly protein TadG